MRIYRRKLRIPWTELVTNGEVLKRVRSEITFINMVKGQLRMAIYWGKNEKSFIGTSDVKLFHCPKEGIS